VSLTRYRSEYLLSQKLWSSNLSFTATFSKHKPLIFLEKVGGLWFLASEKRPYGTEMGLARYFGAQIEVAGWVTDLRQRYDELGYCEPNSKDDFHAI
jgi:hypothetical protein